MDVVTISKRYHNFLLFVTASDKPDVQQFSLPNARIVKDAFISLCMISVISTICKKVENRDGDSGEI